MGESDQPDRDPAVRRLRAVVERLLREGRAEARSDGTTHVLFCVAASAAGGEALRGWAV